MEKNKQNAEQIKNFYAKSCKSFKANAQVLVSSDENPSYSRNDSSSGSKMSLRTSFVISKRKPSLTFQSPSDRSEVDLKKADMPFSRTIKNFSKSRKEEVSISKSRPKPTNKSKKKIFVVKSPMMFEDEVIPKAQITTNAWNQVPLTGKDRSARKSEHIRLKKKNNPMPLDNTALPESFNYPL